MDIHGSSSTNFDEKDPVPWNETQMLGVHLYSMIFMQRSGHMSF